MNAQFNQSLGRIFGSSSLSTVARGKGQFVNIFQHIDDIFGDQFSIRLKHASVVVFEYEACKERIRQWPRYV